MRDAARPNGVDGDRRTRAGTCSSSSTRTPRGPRWSASAPAERPPLYGDGRAGERVVQALLALRERAGRSHERAAHRRRRPRLLGPEPRPQLRGASPAASSPGAATPPRPRASAGRRASPARASPPTSTTCWPTTRSTPSCSPRRCRPTAPLAERVLDAGKHCFVEKPLAQSVDDAERAVAAAERAGRMLMVGHLLEYHPGVAKLKEIADLRRARRHPLHLLQPAQPRASCAPTRTRCGRSARTTSRSCCTWPTRSPTSSARAASPTCARASRTSCSASCASRPGLAAHLHLSWLDPHKERRFTVVGSKRMATFDDMDLERKVTVYDKGFDETLGHLRRVHHPRGRHLEPADRQPRAAAARVRALRRVRARRARRRARTAHTGLRVVRVLEGLQAALDASRREQDAAV